MIIVLFGQPHSGKTTLANALIEDKFGYAKHIDGDQLRDIFKNKDFSSIVSDWSDLFEKKLDKVFTDFKDIKKIYYFYTKQF